MSQAGESSEEESRLSGLTIGALTLTPEFDSGVTSYTLETTNATNKVTAAAGDDAEIAIEVNGEALENATSATWVTGENILTVTVTESGKASTTYTVIVTKS